MAIGELCLCGSGKKYEDCCDRKLLPTQNKKIAKQHMGELISIRRSFKKVCMHPCKEECSEQKTGAHTISRASILTLISKDNSVYMPVVNGFTGQLELKSLGIKQQASVFHCFCATHDNNLFKDIDKVNVKFSEKVYFLYAYRIFASTYYKLLREDYCYERLKRRYDYTQIPEVILFYLGNKRTLSILEQTKVQLERGIVNEQYNELETVTMELGYRVNFAVSSCFILKVDLLGNKLYWKDNERPLVYITVVPSSKKTKIIFSWLKSHRNIYGFFKEQIMTVPLKFILKYLNNLLPMNCENMAISPFLWDEWTTNAKDEFKSVVNDALGIINNKAICPIYFKNRNYDLFRVI
ncbi:MAG: SEC-C domain-containing protein [Clostridiales bacterium]|nr:SEC-C domain-containing protein [Clostridiales bacterium]